MGAERDAPGRVGPWVLPGRGQEGHVPDPWLPLALIRVHTVLPKLRWKICKTEGCSGGPWSCPQLIPVHFPSLVQFIQQPPHSKGPVEVLASREPRREGTHHLSGQPGGWYVSLTSTSFVEGWRAPIPLPRVWTQWWGRGQDWGMKGAGHWPSWPIWE